MDIIFCDSCKHYATAAILKKWDSMNGAVIEADKGRAKQAAIVLPGEAPFVNYIEKSVTGLTTVNATTAILVLGFNTRQTGMYSNEHPLVALYHESTVLGGLRFGYNSVTLLGTDLNSVVGIAHITQAMYAGDFYHIVFGSNIVKSGSTHTITLWAKGLWSGSTTPVLGWGSGFDWQLSTSHVLSSGTLLAPTSFKFFNGLGNPLEGYTERHFCDIYALSQSGSDLGKIYVDCLQPIDNGHAENATPSSGESYTCIDEVQINETDYITQAEESYDTFLVSSFGEEKIDQIHAVVNNMVSKVDSLDSPFTPLYMGTSLLDGDGNNYAHYLTVPLKESTEYYTYQSAVYRNPYDTFEGLYLPWTKASISEAEWGFGISQVQDTF